MTEQAENNYEDDEISLLDILVTLAESWKLLVFGSLIAGVLAGALSFLWPKTFESTVIVRLTEAEVALLGAAPVLDPLIVKFTLLPEFDGNLDDARAYLTKKIAIKFDKKTSLSTLTVSSTTPERAQAIASAAIDALQLELLPKGKSKDQVEQIIRINKEIISNNNDAIEQLKKQMGRFGQTDAGLEVVMKYYASLNSEIARKELENIELEKSLTVRGPELFVQQPTLAQRQTYPKSNLFILFGSLLSFFILGLYVFSRKAWRISTRDEKSARKIANIKMLLGWSSGE